MPKFRLTGMEFDFISLVPRGDDPNAQVVIAKAHGPHKFQGKQGDTCSQCGHKVDHGMHKVVGTAPDGERKRVAKRRPKLGSGARFKALSAELAARGVKNPDALAAHIGRKKYGKKRFLELGHKSKRRIRKSEDILQDIAKVKSSVYPDLERVPGKQNWVDRSGGLPSYIERIAKHLHYEKGMPIGMAIASAVEACRRWAHGGGDVNPDTRAKAAAALAEWEAKKTKSKVKTAAKRAGRAAS